MFQAKLERPPDGTFATAVSTKCLASCNVTLQLGDISDEPQGRFTIRKDKGKISIYIMCDRLGPLYRPTYFDALIGQPPSIIMMDP
jgi:hypothetical protein